MYDLIYDLFWFGIEENSKAVHFVWQDDTPDEIEMVRLRPERIGEGWVSIRTRKPTRANSVKPTREGQ